jgi:hypothetical protein
MKKLLYLTMAASILLGAIHPTCLGWLGEKRIKKGLIYTFSAAITATSAFLLGSQLQKSWYTPTPKNLAISAAGTGALAFSSLWAIPKVVECLAEKIHLNTSKDKDFAAIRKTESKGLASRERSKEQNEWLKGVMKDFQNPAGHEPAPLSVEVEANPSTPTHTYPSPTPRSTYSPLNGNGEPVKSSITIKAEKAKKISFWVNLTTGVLGASAGFYASVLKMQLT